MCMDATWAREKRCEKTFTSSYSMPYLLVIFCPSFPCVLLFFPLDHCLSHKTTSNPDSQKTFSFLKNLVT